MHRYTCVCWHADSMAWEALQAIHAHDEDVGTLRLFNSLMTYIRNFTPSASATHMPKTSFKIYWFTLTAK